MRAIEQLVIETFKEAFKEILNEAEAEAEFEAVVADWVFAWVTIYPSGMTRKSLGEHPLSQKSGRWEMPSSWQQYWEKLEIKGRDVEEVISHFSYVHIFATEEGMSNRSKGTDFTDSGEQWEWLVSGNKPPFEVFMDWFMDKLSNVKFDPRIMYHHKASTGGTRAGIGGSRRDKLTGEKIKAMPGSELRPGPDVTREILIRINPIPGLGERMMGNFAKSAGIKAGEIKTNSGVYIDKFGYSAAPRSERERVEKTKRIEGLKFVDPRMYTGLLPAGATFEAFSRVRGMMPTSKAVEEVRQQAEKKAQEKALRRLIVKDPLLAMKNIVFDMAGTYSKEFDVEKYRDRIKYVIYDIATDRFSEQYKDEDIPLTGGLKNLGWLGARELSINLEEYKKKVKELPREKEKMPAVLQDILEYIDVLLGININDVHKRVQQFQEDGWPQHVVDPHSLIGKTEKEKEKEEVKPTPEQIEIVKGVGDEVEKVLPSQLISPTDYTAFLDQKSKNGIIYFKDFDDKIKRALLDPGDAKVLFSTPPELMTDAEENNIESAIWAHTELDDEVEDVQMLDVETKNLDFYHARVSAEGEDKDDKYERDDDELEQGIESQSLEDYLAKYGEQDRDDYEGDYEE